MTDPVFDATRRRDEARPVVDVSNLHVTFQRGGSPVHALRGVSLTIEPGEILGLVGESGSGKTVLGLTLLGLLRGDPPPEITGTAGVLGVDMVSAPPREKRRLLKSDLGAVFQNPMTSLNPTMKVGRQLNETTGSVEESIRLLKAVGVPDPIHRLSSYPHEFSGGQLQRIMIAMAIAGNPALVVADEPTTALDVTVQTQILELLASLRDDLGCSFLLITHDLGVAAEIADRIAVLYAGKLLEMRPSVAVLGEPAHPYSIGLLKSRLELNSDRERPLISLRGEPPDPRSPLHGCPFAPRCALNIAECEVVMPPLADVADGVVACIRVKEAATYRVEIEASPRWGNEEIPEDVAVRLDGVEKTFSVRKGAWSKRPLHALRGIDLEIRRGEAVAVVGESGCGKSTLLRVVARLLSPDKGEVTLADDLEPQMVFQDATASLTPWLSVRELVGERLRGRGLTKTEIRRAVIETLQRVGLQEEVAAVRPRRLSGGQAQRVALARAIVAPPGLLLADEPTSALDVSLGAVVLNLIGRLRRELGLTVMFVTHDLAAARIVADRIAVMYLGEIVEIGSADDIIDSPVHPYTKALLASLPGEGRAPIAVKGEPANPLDPPSGCPYHPRCAEAIDSCVDDPPSLVVVRQGRAAACVHAKPQP